MHERVVGALRELVIAEDLVLAEVLVDKEYVVVEIVAGHLVVAANFGYVVEQSTDPHPVVHPVV